MKPTSIVKQEVVEKNYRANQYPGSDLNSANNPGADNFIVNQSKLLVLRNKLTTTWI